MTRSKPIRVGSLVRDESGARATHGMTARVIAIYPADLTMLRRAFVEFALADGPHRVTRAPRWT